MVLWIHVFHSSTHLFPGGSGKNCSCKCVEGHVLCEKENCKKSHEVKRTEKSTAKAM